MREKTAVDNAGKAWLKRETRPYKVGILFLACLTFLTTVCALAFAYLVRYLVNSAASGEEKRLWIFAAVLLGTLLLKISFKTWSGYLSERLRSKMYSELRARVFSKTLRAPYASLQGYHSGELMNRLTGDAQEIAVDTAGLTPTLVGMATQCVGAVAALLTIDPLFTLIYVLCGGVFGGLTALFRSQIKKRHKAVMEADGKTRAFMQEGLSSVMTLKAYGAEEKAGTKAQSLSNAYYARRMERNRLRTEMRFLFALLSNFGLIFAVVWCSVSVLNGNDDYGAILSVVLLLMQLQQPLTSLSSVLPVYYSRMASAERLAELDALPEEPLGERENVQILYGETQALCLEDVDFSYGREAIFSGANARIEKGEIVCLTGASGEGKSTLFKLLLQMFPCDGGSIYLQTQNGRRALTQRERGLFAYVPQGNFLFSGTIYENLQFFSGDEGAFSKEKIRGALLAACAEFVYELPEGLQTKLGEGGEGLSEGQLQRLAVARAILSDRPVLLLDEATSALDEDTERRLLQNIKELRDKTCIIVTHRPAAKQIADRILLVDKGRIQENSPTA